MSAINPFLTLKQARQEWGWSLLDLAREIEHIRRKKNLPESSLENIRRQIVEYERKNTAGPLWRELLAEALRKEPEELFGVELYREIPSSDLYSLPISQDFINIFNAKLDNLIQLEHMFGSTYVKDTIGSDLFLLRSYTAQVPDALRKDFSLLLARVSECAGWNAQELGDFERADQLTSFSYNYFRYSSIEDLAMILMRRSNITLNSDPYLARDLIDDAVHEIEKIDDYMLKGSIYTQKALTNFKLNDRKEFKNSIARAMEYSIVNIAESKLASYATVSYVASGLAQCYISENRYQDAVKLLLQYKNSWSSIQKRDQAIFMLRLLLATIKMNDHVAALDLFKDTLALYKAAPSFRGKGLLKMIRNSLSSDRIGASTPVKIMKNELNTILKL